RTTVETNVFVTLPIRKRSPGCARTRPATTEYPLASRIVRSPSRTRRTAPGTPAATTWSSAAFSDVSSGGAAAAACAPTHSSRAEQIAANACTTRTSHLLRAREADVLGDPIQPRDRCLAQCGGGAAGAKQRNGGPAVTRDDRPVGAEPLTERLELLCRRRRVELPGKGVALADAEVVDRPDVEAPQLEHQVHLGR